MRWNPSGRTWSRKRRELANGDLHDLVFGVAILPMSFQRKLTCSLHREQGERPALSVRTKLPRTAAPSSPALVGLAAKPSPLCPNCDVPTLLPQKALYKWNTCENDQRTYEYQHVP